MSIDARSKLKAKIRALLTMASGHGTTEAEAANAAEKAAALMREHDLAYDDIEEVRSERYGARKRDVNCNVKRRSLHEVAGCAKTVAKLFHCKVWRSRDDRVRIFFGTEHDTEAAHNLLDMLAAAMEFEFASYLRNPDRDNWQMHGRMIRPNFMAGMIERLNERITTIVAAREAADEAQNRNAAGMSTALVTITKRQIVNERYVDYAKAQGLNLQPTTRRGPRYSSSHAISAGREAADRTDLGGGKLSGNRKLLS